VIQPSTYLRRIAIALAASWALQAGSAWANPIVLNNTGIPGANATPDLNYVLVSSPVGPNTYIVDTPYPGWIANQPGSKWISPVQNPSTSAAARGHL
jgi:hypothetical protein